MQNYRNKDSSKLSFEKKLNKSEPAFTESDEYLDDHRGQTSPMIEAIVLSNIYEDDLNLDRQDEDISVKTSEEIEIPYDCSPEVTLETINNYLNQIKKEKPKAEDSKNE